MIFTTCTSLNLLPCLRDNVIIHNNKEYRMGFELQGIEELVKSNLCDLLHGPKVLPKESGETREICHRNEHIKDYTSGSMNLEMGGP
jgi:hypothetical protein